MKGWLARCLVTLGALFLSCMTSLSQTKLYASDIGSAALQSDKNYQAAWQGTKPHGWEYGEYEIPSQYWTDAVKELQPVKVYDHHLNVAIVMRIRDGMEEGIYIHNAISSYAMFQGAGDPSGFESIQPEAGSLINFRRRRAPRFEDYPATAAFTGTPASPKIVTSSKQDMEKIRNGVEKGWGVSHGNTEGKGANFAGHFILVKWSCGSPCLGMAIVDAKTGDVFSPPDTTNCNVSFNLLHSLSYPGQAPQNPGVQFRLDSNLLIIKSSSPGFPELPYTSYYLWQGNRWSLLRKVPLQRTTSDSPGR